MVGKENNLKSVDFFPRRQWFSQDNTQSDLCSEYRNDSQTKCLNLNTGLYVKLKAFSRHKGKELVDRWKWRFKI